MLAFVPALCTCAAAAPAPAPAPPPALIVDLTADAIAYPATDPLALPPGTDHFRIRYGVAAPDAPDRLRFEYRLDGVDRNWMAAGARRATSYTNIGPGAYTFRVRARADGAPGPEAFLRLHVAPTFTQTLGFRLACVSAALLAGALGYRYRVRHVTGRLADRLQVRAAERDRLARTLHDGFLQTVQGLVLRVDAVAATLPPDDGARRQLEHVLDDASEAIGVGRDQLQALRAGDVAVLESMLEQVLDDLLDRYRGARPDRGGAPTMALRVEGKRRRVPPALAEDIAAIACEALRHAWTHGAGRLRIVLAYRRRALVLRVSDDGRRHPAGVAAAAHDPHDRRIDTPSVAAMEARAAHIGARLDIATRARGGTVTLNVPAVRAYMADPAPGDIA